MQSNVTTNNPADLAVREFSDFFRFFFKTPKEDKKVVFYAEHEGYFSCYEGFIRELTEARGQKICYVTSDSTDPVLNTKNQNIIPFYQDKILYFFMRFADSPVLVMTLTDLNRIQLKRSIKPVHYIYAFHSLVSTHMMYRFGAFDYYDSILCTGPYQIDEIRKQEELYEIPVKKLVESGYYRLERVYENYRKYKEENREKPADAQKTILIAPSWGEKNVLETCGLELAGTLLESGCKVIVRPHPETVKRNPELINQFKEKFGKIEDFTLELSVSGDESLIKSDVLISDLSGVVLEYAFGTERPVLFMDVPYKIKNERYKELEIEPFELKMREELGITASPGEIEKIPEKIEELAKEKDKWSDKIIKLREENIYNFANSSKVSADYIMGLIEKN